jgi:hypothetical protein
VPGQLAGCAVRYRGVYSPPVDGDDAARIAGWFESNHGPLRQVAALATRYRRASRDIGRVRIEVFTAVDRCQRAEARP